MFYRSETILIPISGSNRNAFLLVTMLFQEKQCLKTLQFPLTSPGVFLQKTFVTWRALLLSLSVPMDAQEQSSSSKSKSENLPYCQDDEWHSRRSNCPLQCPEIRFQEGSLTYKERQKSKDPMLCLRLKGFKTWMEEFSAKKRFL